MDESVYVAQPQIERVRHELKRRVLTVAKTTRLTPHMIRITLKGEDLSDFVSLSPDDHVKIFVDDGEGDVAMRDYTPRRFDTDARTLELDFALHDAGPATRWALNAVEGSKLTVGGPKGSGLVQGVKRWLLIGDETALPAIGRRLEEAPPEMSFTVIVAVPHKEDEQDLQSKAQVDVKWIHRAECQSREAAPFLDVLGQVELSPQTFAWVAAEAGVVKTIRRHLVEDLGHKEAWLKASGYWTAGRAE